MRGEGVKLNISTSKERFYHRKTASRSSLFADFGEPPARHKEHCFGGYPFAYVKTNERQVAYYGRVPEPRRPDGIIPARKGVEIPLYIRKQDVWDTGCDRRRHLPPPCGGRLFQGSTKSRKENHTAYAWTWVYSPKAQDVGAWIEFQNYSRSEMDLPSLRENGITGKAECGSTTGKSCLGMDGNAPDQINEVLLGNENCVVRPPMPVHLQKGWNKVFMKLPVGKFTAPEIRLPKWMFTFVFVTPDGEKAVDGLVYSPNKKR